ncbi:MAG: ChaN family lipoprotein [Proteobacteria bacterium]|nr:ChaN family lipoprotein [Pseudomonadota bacterium]MBU1596561.1 ChaN family lipoprotein [Pseudomonadota bacterium]
MPLALIPRALAPGRGAFLLPRAAWLLPALVLGLCACARPAPTQQPMPVSFLPAPGEFLSNAGDRLSPEALRARAASAAYVLVGESHGNACDHEAEARIITLLAHGETVPVVGLEMAPASLNPVLRAFSEGALAPEELEARLDWKTNWGHPFAKYLPVFQAIRRFRLPVYGLNVPPGVIRRLSAAAMQNATLGDPAGDPVASLSPEDRAQLPARIIPPAPEQEAFLREVMGSHPRAKARGGTADDPRQLARFQLIQSVWDSAMAEQAVGARRATGRPVVVLAGAAHVEGGLGIARRLRVLDPGAQVLLVSPWRGDALDKADAEVRVYCPESFESRMGMTLVSRPWGGAFEYVVGAVVRGSRAEGAGLRPGDVVERAGGYRMRSLNAMHLAGSDAFREKKSLVLVIRRGEEALSVDLGPLGRQGRP